MVKITIENLGGKTLFIHDLSLPVLRQIHNQYVDWMHDCGGKGRCTSCKMIVLAGPENLTPPSPAEKKYKLEGALADNERLTCQCRLTGDIVVRVPDQYKLRHVKYSD